MKRHSRLMSCAVLSTPPSGGRRSAYTAPPASVSRYVRFERPPETSSNSTGKVRPSTCEASQRPTRPESTPAAAMGAASAIAQLGSDCRTQVTLEHLAALRARQRGGTEQQVGGHLERSQRPGGVPLHVALAQAVLARQAAGEPGDD